MSEKPSNWTSSSLEELASSITSGGTPTSGDKRYYLEAGGYPFAKTEDLSRSNSKYLSECDLNVSDLALKNSAAKVYPKGTVLVSMYGTIGLPKITDIELAANQALCALIPPFKCNADFLYHMLCFIRLDWLKDSGQTTQANISGGAVKKRVIYLPSAGEQKAIANILDTLDTQIRETEAIIAKLQQVKQGLLHDLLTRGIDANGQLRPPRDQAPELYKESPLGWIPREWEVPKLGDMYSEPSKNGLYKSPKFHGRGPLMVQMGNIFSSGSIIYEGASRVEVTAAELESFGLAEGDILFARRSLVMEGAGKACLVDKVPQPATFESSIVRVRFKRSEVLPEFASLFLQSDISFSDRRRFIRQVAVSGVSSSDIREFYCLKPAITEQRAIINRIESLEKNLGLENENSQKLKKQKSGLMDDLLTGRVCVTPLLDTAKAS